MADQNSGKGENKHCNSSRPLQLVPLSSVHNTQVILPGNNPMGAEMSVLIPEYRGVLSLQVSRVHMSMEENLGP